jgi:thiol-disulfide isomerase/thioredoxin
MKTSATSLIPGIIASLLLAIPALAEKQHKLSEWKIGKVLFGEKLSKADMKDKVVVVENWGVHCPPCVAALPHLAELEKKHREQGLIIIGAESQGSSKDDIKPLIEKAGVEYIVTEGAEGPIEVTGIPRAFVFDRAGILVFDGNPNGKDFETAVTKALGEGAPAPADAEKPAAPLIDTRSWTNADGKEIRAAVKSADATNVTFIMDGGKEVKYPLAKLSEDSRKTITEAAGTED